MNEETAPPERDVDPAPVQDSDAERVKDANESPGDEPTHDPAGDEASAEGLEEDRRG
jgi:hypothetical protein